MASNFLQVKAALHLHIDLDPLDNIAYSGFQAINKAYQLNFRVLSFTCHEKVIDIKPFQKYAKERGVLLIPGIEKTIQKKHVLILNVTKLAEQINTFKDLKLYKQNHPESLIVAPHPFFFFGNCLKKDLIDNIELFDAIEYNYFYHKILNPNNKALHTAQKYNLPLIGTSDIHLLEYFNPTYTKIRINELTTTSVIQSIKKNQLEIITKSFSIFELIKILYKMMFIGSKKNALQFEKNEKSLSRKSLLQSQTKPSNNRLS